MSDAAKRIRQPRLGQGAAEQSVTVGHGHEFCAAVLPVLGSVRGSYSDPTTF